MYLFEIKEKSCLTLLNIKQLLIKKKKKKKFYAVTVIDSEMVSSPEVNVKVNV